MQWQKTMIFCFIRFFCLYFPFLYYLIFSYFSFSWISWDVNNNRPIHTTKYVHKMRWARLRRITKTNLLNDLKCIPNCRDYKIAICMVNFSKPSTKMPSLAFAFEAHFDWNFKKNEEGNWHSFCIKRCFVMNWRYSFSVIFIS